MNDDKLMDVLTREGLLINVSVRYWRAAKKLNPVDIGFEAADVDKRLVSLGHKKLVPSEETKAFDQLESRAHQAVASSTFEFMGGVARFLPNAKLEGLSTTLGALQEEFNAELVRFKERYLTVVEKAKIEWVTEAKKLSFKPDVVIASMAKAYPRVDQLDNYFEFKVRTFNIQAPADMTAELQRAGVGMEVIRARQKAISDARRQFSDGVGGFVKECVQTMREETAKLCTEVLETVEGSRIGVSQKTLNRLTAFIDQFKSMNFVGDKEFETKLEELKTQITSKSAEDFRRSSESMTSLRDGIRSMADLARNMAQEDVTRLVDRFGQVGSRKFQLEDA
jgi:hypothetical protein